ncbi:MAG: hypothetical protein ACI9UN_002745 [Granulosicoccus sp.]|jgi:hypothetical protein
MTMLISWPTVFKFFLGILIVFFLPVGGMLAHHYYADDIGFSGYGRHSTTNQAPDQNTEEAVIQVYAARAARWRGAVGVHTWIATKRSYENQYTRLEVIGYRVYWGGDAVRIRSGTPDAMWFGHYPTLLREIRGDSNLDAVIDQIHVAADQYPYSAEYRVWPGPNSNTFTAYVGRAIPELRLELPSNAVGKDFLPTGKLLAAAPSGTGIQFSVNGYFGILLGLEEGIELNVLGLSAGLDFLRPAIKLPGIGRIGFSDRRRFIYRQPPRSPPST